jgi:hypothetical protein
MQKQGIRRAKKSTAHIHHKTQTLKIGKLTNEKFILSTLDFQSFSPQEI